MNTKQQGDIGVAMAIAYYTRLGYAISYPLTDNTKYDLVVDTGYKLNRVQCKSSNYQKDGKYHVELRTFGGNQSWGGEVKRVSGRDCELLFVYTFDGKCYEFPIPYFDGKARLTLGKLAQQYIVWNS